MRGVKDDRVSPGLARYLERLSREEQETLAELLRQPCTYLAEDMSDVLLILRSLDR